MKIIDITPALAHYLPAYKTGIKATEMSPQNIEGFYTECFKILNRSKIPFLVGGSTAVNIYTGMTRPTKDMDIFCKPGDFPRIVETFADQGFRTKMEDERWVIKIYKGKECFFDLLFNSSIPITPVTNEWFHDAPTVKLHNAEVKLLPPTELIWAKVFVQDRYKYDGSDVAHMILRKHKDIKWKRLLAYMDQYWEVLFIHLLNFRFIYPSEREKVPRWLLDELVSRVEKQLKLPTSRAKICRGQLFSRHNYVTDVKEWGFIDLIGPNE